MVQWVQTPHFYGRGADTIQVREVPHALGTKEQIRTGLFNHSLADKVRENPKEELQPFHLRWLLKLTFW